MAKPRKKSNSDSQAMLKAIQGAMVQDSFQNAMARTGYGTPSMLEATRYPITRLTQNYNLMNSLYRNSWLARRVIDLIPKDMLRNGWKYETDLPPEKTDLLQKTERLTRLKAGLLQGLNWGRLYGGAAGLMMIEGQESPEQLKQPLDIEAIMPGDFKGLLIVDRWSGVYPDLELITDISSPEFGLPKYYRFTDNTPTAENYVVHHSRIIRFVGDDLPEWEKQAETYWGASIIESCYEELRKRDNTSANIANLIFQANLKVLGIEDLGELLTGTNKGAQRDFYQTMQAQNWLQSNFGMLLMSREDTFQQFTLQNFTGLNDIYESFMLDLSGASQIPATKLFGRSPAGMNATGESDLRNYYDVIEGEQEAHLRPALEKLLPVICMSTLGQWPDDIQLVFNPVETPSEDTMGESVKWRSDAIYQAHDRGIIPDRTALQELKQTGEPAGIFTNITDEMINSASDEALDPLDVQLEQQTSASEEEDKSEV